MNHFNHGQYQEHHTWKQPQRFFVERCHIGYEKYKEKWNMGFQGTYILLGNRYVSNQLRQKAEVKRIFCASIEMNSGCWWSIG